MRYFHMTMMDFSIGTRFLGTQNNNRIDHDFGLLCFMYAKDDVRVTKPYLENTNDSINNFVESIIDR